MWMKVDDGLHAHRKTRAVTKSHPDKTRDAAPMGLWVLAGSWAAQNGTDGWVPEDELDRWDDDWQPLVKRLVRAGYWWPHERDGEPGYGFTDWHDYNDPADLASKSGSYGNHVRWHVNVGKADPDCEHCPSEPSRPDIAPESGGDRGAIGGERSSPPPPEQPKAAPSQAESVSAGQSDSIGGESGGESRFASGAIALPDPNPTRTRPVPNPVTSAEPPQRPDVDRLCEHLADRIAEDGSKRPTIGKGWRDAARLMLDRDGRTEQEAHAAIDWCQSHHFWRANILSMPKLREKYDQLRKQAMAEQQTAPTARQRAEGDMWDRAYARAAARDGGDQ